MKKNNINKLNKLHLENLEELSKNKDGLLLIYESLKKDLSKLDKNYWDFTKIFRRFMRTEFNKNGNIRYYGCHNVIVFDNEKGIMKESNRLGRIQYILNRIRELDQSMEGVYGRKTFLYAIDRLFEYLEGGG